MTDTIRLCSYHEPDNATTYRWAMKGLVREINSHNLYIEKTGYFSRLAEGAIEMWFEYVPHKELEDYLSEVITHPWHKNYAKTFLANDGTCDYRALAWPLLAKHLLAFGKLKIRVAAS